MRLTIALLFLNSGLAISAGEPEGQAARKELAKLQGTWKLVELEMDGQVFEYPEDTQPRWLVTETRVSRQEDGKQWASLAIDLASKPKLLDLTRVGAERSMEAIYSVDDDTWRICVNPATEGVRERPTEFSTKGKPGWKLWVLKREKH
jgi:uncharacterized protein (TIGR03067 family)